VQESINFARSSLFFHSSINKKNCFRNGRKDKSMCLCSYLLKNAAEPGRWLPLPDRSKAQPAHARVCLQNPGLYILKNIEQLELIVSHGVADTLMRRFSKPPCEKCMCHKHLLSSKMIISKISCVCSLFPFFKYTTRQSRRVCRASRRQRPNTPMQYFPGTSLSVFTNFFQCE
jgi:hypothetical protein